MIKFILIEYIHDTKNYQYIYIHIYMYLDEIFCIQTQGSKNLNGLFNCINSLHPTIKFTKDYSTTADKLETDLYCKANDRHQYFHAQLCHRNVYKRSIACRQVVRLKRICSIEEKLNSRLEQLKPWLVKRGYKEDHVDSEIERVKLVKRTVSFQKRDKKVDDSITIFLTYHPALNQLYEILRRAHEHVSKSPRLHSALPSLLRLTFRNSKTIRDKLVRSKLKEFIYKDAGTNICGHSNCDICKIFETGDQFESAVTKKKFLFFI